MTEKTRQLSHWTGGFGTEYLARNAEAAPGEIEARAACFRPILDACPKGPETILEVGANVGKNLRALARLGDAELHAVEPFDAAFATLTNQPGLALARATNCDGSALPYGDGEIDLVFTSGVLIHVGPDELPGMMAEIVRVARRYVLCNEYFAKTPEELTYRGEQGLLFKRDFGRAYVEGWPELVPLATGFMWSATTPFDDTTWWLFEKPAGN
ncbi:MAG: pseudaminic acid biosynthesis-associated methylase [Alphaproteobacteria bacterium]